MPGLGIVHVCVCVCVCAKITASAASRRAHGAGARRSTLEAGLFDGGDLFSVGLYMVAPRLAEGALRNVADLSKKTGLERARREREIRGRDFGVRNASKHQ